MSIQADLSELSSLNREIKLLNKRLKGLRREKKEAEARIAVYIRAKDLPGIKHRGTAVLLEESERRAPKTKNQRNRDAQEVLERYGIHNPEIVLKELLEARKGDSYMADKLKTKKYKNTHF